MIVLNPEDYKIPEFISPERFYSLKHKEQDYILLLFSRKHTASEIRRMLYLTSKTGYWRIKDKLRIIIAEEQEKNRQKVLF
jgi:hypothetical protein